MSRRPVRRVGGSNIERAQQADEARPLAPEAAELEAVGDVALPRDHPRWLKDRFTVTAATKSLIDRLKPLALRVFGFWDHRVHRLDLDDATIGVDACGSYRCE